MLLLTSQQCQYGRLTSFEELNLVYFNCDFRTKLLGLVESQRNLTWKVGKPNKISFSIEFIIYKNRFLTEKKKIFWKATCNLLMTNFAKQVVYTSITSPIKFYLASSWHHEGGELFQGKAKSINTPQLETADLVTFTEEILNGKLHIFVQWKMQRLKNKLIKRSMKS